MIHGVDSHEVAARAQYLRDVANQINRRRVVQVMEKANRHNNVERVVTETSQLVDVGLDDIDAALLRTPDVARIVVEPEVANAARKQVGKVRVAAPDVEHAAAGGGLQVLVDDDLHAAVSFDQPPKSSIAARGAKYPVTNHRASIAMGLWTITRLGQVPIPTICRLVYSRSSTT